MKKIIDLSGNIFGKLKVISLNQEVTGLKNRLSWDCICECGNKTTVFNSSLICGNTTSCGCKRWEKIKTHGLTNTKIYKVWKDMISRCFYKSCTNYKNYGGRGITVSEEWKSLVNFVNDMLPSYEIGLELNRKDNNSNYSKENCNWITHKENCNNTRRSFTVEINGKNFKLQELSEIYDLKLETIRSRYYHGIRGENLVKKSLNGSGLFNKETYNVT